MRSIYLKPVGRKSVQVQVNLPCSCRGIREQAGDVCDIPVDHLRLVWKGRTLLDDDEQLVFGESDTVLVFKASKVAPDKSKWEISPEEEDGDEALRKLREKVHRVSNRGWSGTILRVMRDTCHMPDEVIGLLLSVKHWQWTLLFLWLAASRVAYVYEWGPVYIILSGFVVIFTNLGRRREGEMSAYSVFNEGFRELPGTFNAADVDTHLRRGQM
mmetsp:Transcript_12326/g.23554  ORF Transcript_12326/g.23554 Transcript_12326/m.23554 type:complete len:214 (+) Transcript_12326:140-781(+)